MKKLYAVVTKDELEARLPRTTTAIYTSHKEAVEMVEALRKSNSNIIWDVQEWQETLTGEYLPQDL